MKDLYSIGEVHGKEDKVFDGVIAVRLNDSSKDFSNVLDIIYRRFPTTLNRTTSSDEETTSSLSPSDALLRLKLGDLVGVMRVAWKYELEDITNEAVSQLDHLLPLTTPQDIQKLDVYKADSGLALAANVVNLSRECNMPQFGPMAFYALATSEWTTDNFQALSSVFPILSAQMHLRLNAGRVTLQKAVMEAVFKNQEPCATCSSLPWPDLAKTILHPLEILSREETLGEDETPRQTCGDCPQSAKNTKEKLLKEVLDKLPAIFKP